MKKFLFLAVMMTFALASFSQVRFGVKAGLNLASQKFSGFGINITGDNLVGFNVGGVVDIPVASSFYFQPGVSYSLKGTKSTFLDETVKTTLNYVDVPLNLMYKVKASKVAVVILAGPNIGFGISGKSISDTDSEDVKFGSDEDQVKRLDFGLNFGAGVEFGKFQVTAQYGLGLSNLANTADGDDSKVKNNVISFNAAYFF